MLHTLALVPSFLQHFFVLKKDPNVDLSYSLSSWIGCAICACFAVPGYWLMTAPLLAVHGVITGVSSFRTVSTDIATILEVATCSLAILPY